MIYKKNTIRRIFVLAKCQCNIKALCSHCSEFIILYTWYLNHYQNTNYQHRLFLVPYARTSTNCNTNKCVGYDSCLLILFTYLFNTNTRTCSFKAFVLRLGHRTFHTNKCVWYNFCLLILGRDGSVVSSVLSVRRAAGSNPTSRHVETLGK